MIRLVVLDGASLLPQGFGQLSPAFLHLLFVVSWLYRCIIVKAYNHDWKRKRASIKRNNGSPPTTNRFFFISYFTVCM